MKKSLIISAHLDDAVLSAGQFIAGHPNCDVLTVFAGVPMYHPDKDGEAYVTAYDLDCGFETSKDAVVTRRQENDEALALLQANPLYLDLLDHQYRNGEDVDLTTELLPFIKNQKYEMVLAPLGLLHPDHRAIGNMFMANPFPNLYLYEDLPHRVTHPEKVVERLKEIPGAKLTFIGDGPIQNKVRALWCYRSQISRGDLNPYNLYVPERFWKV